MKEVKVIGARIHNLKNINVNIPKGKIVVITGISGSGKSSLAFDIIFDEAMNRYLQSIGFPPKFDDEKPFDLIEGLSPTVAVEQRTTRVVNPRSTVGTKTGLYSLLRMLYATEGILLCPICNIPVNQDALECDTCGMVVERKEVKHFSFNEPSGLCLSCKGKGYTMHITEQMVVKDYNKNLIEITKAGSGCFADQLRFVEQLPRFYNFDIDKAYKDLSDEIKKVFLYGSGKKLSFQWESKRFSGELEREFEGIIPHMKRAMAESKSAYRRQKISKNYMVKQVCEECQGYRINEEARKIKIGKKHIGELAMMTCEELILHLKSLIEEEIKTTQGNAISENIVLALERMKNVGLSYLHLNRSMPTLSGGELQRLSLMTHLDGGLDSLIYILDEPSMSLHEQEKEALVSILQKLRDLGNTVIIVEHDKQFIEIAEEILDIGPGAGHRGGEIVYQGPLETIKKVEGSYTGQYLKGKIKLPEKSDKNRREMNSETKYLTIKHANTHNLQNVEVKIPLRMMVGIAGVSGSGKSSLILNTLVPLLKPYFKRGNKVKKKKKSSEDNDEDNGEDLLDLSGILEGWNNIENFIVVNQKPISRVRTSTPCSYLKIWDKIRRIFAKTHEAKNHEFTAGHFSYNSEKGRCPVCKGQGVKDLQISFLNSFTIPCRECKGKRYKPEILEVKYKGKTISDVLNMTVTEAYEFFKDNPTISKVLKVLEDIGMGYITLGQPSPTLSGGEAQRVKLAKELGKTRKGHSLYILDEPTVGLSFYDAVKLVELLEKLVQEGNSVIIIEHDIEILSYCDYLIELGPEGGPKGGNIIAIGTPAEVKSNKHSNTAKYLR
ncbi:MAG: ATP-binding cassette domain-containing protein [Candidatus Lokiarchaeota archaeon]|nr:ATP-binding cassette domain-containing protein [Candidatus Lokiarchaeota archaeon]MBD3337513.1 ATP-binding cassette domain-containing protein [Candidatus Lokiarchaeota archaeon]